MSLSRALGWFLAVATMSLACGGEVPAYRLPGDVVPESYRLRVVTHLQNFTFEGDARITVRCVEATDTLKIHLKELDVDEASVELLHQDTPLDIKGHSYDKENEFYVISLKEKLREGEVYVIHIPYKGNLTDLLAGYYRSSYVDNETGEKRWLALTDFEPTDARRAFPCFDEPAMKAKFEITMGRSEGYVSLSNMPLVKTEPMEGIPGWYWDHFQESVPMSTYLVAFIVSDFVSLESDKSHRTLFRVWARRDAIEQAKYASVIGPKILEYFEEYFNVSYPLPKQDMIAIPDFNAGAMENWGLITYRESALLYDPNVSSVSNKKSVAKTIAHELAHQWFGNLVSPKWWTDIWLNEGFATYVATLGVDHVEPKWKDKDFSALSLLVSTFGLDSLRSSHPVSLPIGSPNEIPQLFDTISYRKGSFLLRMLNNFLTEETFRRGVTRYLRLKMFGNAEQDDLWQQLTEQAHEDGTLANGTSVKTIMDSWTTQTGFPVLTVTRDYLNGTATVNQRRFLREDDPAKRDTTTTWWVPLTYTHQENPDFETTKPRTWMESSEYEVTVEDLPGKDKWLIFNIQASGLYKVNYDEANWKLLINLLQSEEFQQVPELNRAQLMEDGLDLARAGELSYEVALDSLLYLGKEKAYLPWKAALGNLGHMKNMLQRTAGFGRFKRFLRDLLTPVYEELRFQPRVEEDLLESLRRSQVLSWACFLHVGDCVDKAQQSFSLWMQKEDPDTDNPISPTLKSLTYCTAVKHGGEKEWEFLWQRYLKSNVASERSTILSSLGCTEELWLLQRYLEWAVSKDSKIRRQDSSSVFSSVCRNKVGYFLAKDFLMRDFKKIHEFYGSKSGRLSRFISSVSTYMNTDSELKELQSFCSKNKDILRQNTLAVDQSLESVEANVNWMKKNYDVIIHWLDKHSGENTL